MTKLILIIHYSNKIITKISGYKLTEGKVAFNLKGYL